MKKIVLTAILALSSFSAFADHCARYADSPRYLKAIQTVAKHQDRSFEEFCNRPGLLEIEAQPNRIITPNGDVIPHVRVELHFSYDSCSYLVNELNYTITKGQCYSGF